MAIWMSVADQLARLQLARSKSEQDCGVALQLARLQLARLQLARLQLARSGSTASDQLARLLMSASIRPFNDARQSSSRL